MNAIILQKIILRYYMNNMGVELYLLISVTFPYSYLNNYRAITYTM